MRLEVESVTFSYGARPVLRDVSFSAGSGDLLCVLGPNGVGKSTLFRCLLGLQGGWQGRITLDGEGIRLIPPARLARLLAYIPQSSAPVFNYTVFQTVLMGTTARVGTLRSPGKAEERAAREALERFGIAHLAERGCGQVSGGERQLALIARAVAQQAGVLVMDEPTASLDYGNQVRVLEEVRSLAAQGYTVIMSTHNPDHALLYGSRALALLDGRVECCGPPREALNEALLRRLYGVEVRLHRVEGARGPVWVCVPQGGPDDVPVDG